MSHGFEVICAGCKEKVEHRCNSNVLEAVTHLLTWVPESGLATPALEKAFFAAAKEYGWNAEKDTLTHPFFGSQAWSYPLLGSKDTARSFHGAIENLLRALGIDSHEIMKEYYAERKLREEEETERKNRKKEREDQRKKDIRYLKSKAPLSKRKDRLKEVLVKVRVPKEYRTLAELNHDLDHIRDEYLKTWYKGGINPKVNSQVVEGLRAAAIANLLRRNP